MWLLNLDNKRSIEVKIQQQFVLDMVKAGAVPHKPFTLKPKQGVKLKFKLEYCETTVTPPGEAAAYIALDERTLNRHIKKHGLEIIEIK